MIKNVVVKGIDRVSAIDVLRTRANVSSVGIGRIDPDFSSRVEVAERFGWDIGNEIVSVDDCEALENQMKRYMSSGSKSDPGRLKGAT